MQHTQDTASVEVALAPIGESDRIGSLDVLRGVALLGILAMNIQAFSMIGPAYFNPTAYGDLEGINLWVWRLCHIFADQKFMTIFSMLFGAGIVVFTSRIEAKGNSAAGLHYRRTAWLILFGLLHAHLLWYGDILYSYGMCALVAYLFRRLRPGWLIVIGLLLTVIPSLLSIGFGVLMSVLTETGDISEEMLVEFSAQWAPSLELVQEELNAYRGSWLDQAAHRSMFSLMFQTLIFAFFIAWRVGGLMLIGMALYKLGVFSAARSRSFYIALILIGLILGIPAICYGMYRNFEAEWSFEYSQYYGTQFNYWASMLIALGWVGLVMLICKSNSLRPLTSPFAAVGRMAFTNYIMHTVICTTIFYGHGFGQYGYFERKEQFLLVLAIWAFQLIFSPIWLHYFRFGPLEWLWRSLSYWRAQPLLKR